MDSMTLPAGAEMLPLIVGQIKGPDAQEPEPEDIPEAEAIEETPTDEEVADATVDDAVIDVESAEDSGSTNAPVADYVTGSGPEDTSADDLKKEAS